MDYCLFFACDLRRANMRKASLIRADLRGACLRGASLTGADLSDADLREGSFATYDPKKGLNFTNKGTAWVEGGGGVDMRGVMLASANLTGVIATNSNFSDADMTRTIFIRGDLSGANLSGADLSLADLSQCVLKNVNMRNAVMVKTVIDYSSLQNVDMTGALTDKPAGKTFEALPLPLDDLRNLHGLWLSSKSTKGRRLDLSHFDLRDAPSFAKQDLTMIIAEHSVWLGQSLAQANIQASQFKNSDLRSCNFGSADMRGSDFSNCNLTGSKFRDVRLEPLLLDNQRFLKSNFSGTNLRHADFTNANLHDVNFANADLSYADFTGADVADTNFTGAKLDDAKINPGKISATA
jgi:uncharacterized protein YjbI with pentapeptide repeats